MLGGDHRFSWDLQLRVQRAEAHPADAAVEVGWGVRVAGGWEGQVRQMKWRISVQWERSSCSPLWLCQVRARAATTFPSLTCPALGAFSLWGSSALHHWL